MGGRRLLTATELQSLLAEAGSRECPRGRLFLVGDTSQVLERWIPSVTSFTLAGDPGAPAIRERVEEAARGLEMRVEFESPAEVVPLPPGAEGRHRETPLSWGVDGGAVQVLHFDPYSVICRGIVRGDEPDYHTARRYLRQGWVTLEHMTELFDALLPQFGNETIAQDPAEFRRKLKGLIQMWRSEAS